MPPRGPIKSAGTPCSPAGSLTSPSCSTDALNDFFYDQILETFYEDREVLEAQQHYIDSNGAPPPEVDINADAGALQARQVLDRLIAAEAA